MAVFHFVLSALTEFKTNSREKNEMLIANFKDYSEHLKNHN